MISGAAIGIGAGAVVGGGDLGTGGGSGPVTDATITAIDASGWQVTSSAPASSVGKSVVIQPSIFTAGVAGTGSAISIPVRARLRQPAPNDALNTASTCRLADPVCASDTVLGSGVLNNSTEYSPVCIANWISGERLIVGNSVTVYVAAFHYFGIDAIIGTADDGSGHTVNAISTSQIVVPGNDPCKVIGYALTFDVTTLNDKQAFTVNAKVYPKRGASTSVLDSSVVTSITGSTTTRNFGPRIFRKDVTLAANPIYAAVSPAGNDGTGVVSTTWVTAQASPFATLDGARVALKNSTLSGKAANSDDGCVIRLLAGSHALNNMTTFTNSSGTALIIEAAPGESAATVTLTSNATAPVMRTQWLRVRNLKWARGGAGFLVSLTGGAAAKVFCEDVTFDNNAQGSNLFGTHTVSIIGGTLTNTSSSSSNGMAAASTTKHELIRGVTFNAPAGANLVGIDHYCVVGCVGASVIISNSNNSADNTIVAFNRFMKQTGTAILFLLPSGGPNIVGIAHVQNVFEYISATSNPVIRVSGDGESTNINHYVYMNNTFAGMDAHGRENMLYDESTGTTRRTHKWILDLNNGKNSANTKIERFVYYSQANADAPNRIGAWSHAMGVGARNNHHRYRNASAGDIGFGPEDFGINTSAPTTNTPPGDDPKFVNYQGVTGTTASPVAGAGGGDYHVQAGSPYIGKVPANDQFLDFDLDGVARKKDGTGALGAYEFAA